MGAKHFKTFLVFVLGAFSLGVLLIGQYSPSSSRIITIHIDGIQNNEMSSKVESLLRLFDGIETIILDEKTSLCTFRYDSGKTNIGKIESYLANMGIRITPLEVVKLVGSDQDKSEKKDKKLFSVKVVSGASR